MDTVIDFIEKLGASAELQHLTEDQALQLLQQRFDIALTGDLHADIAADIDASKKLVCAIFAAEEGDADSVNARFVSTVEALLDVRTNVVCMIFVSENDKELVDKVA